MADELQEYFANTANKEGSDSSLDTAGDLLQEYADSLKGASDANTNTEVPDFTPTETVQTEEVEQTQTNVDDTTPTSFSEESFVKEKTGGKYSSFEDWENSIKEELKPKELSFENETSKGVYELLTQGKLAEVYDILHKKQMAETIQAKPDAEVLKAYIKANNPEFNEQEVDDEFNEKYTLDEFSFDENKLGREKKKLNQRIKSDVDNAKQFFNKLADDIKLPVYQQPVQQTVQADDTVLQEERIKYLTSLRAAEQKVKQLPFSWKDDKAGIAIEGKFDVQQNELLKYSQSAEDIEAYYSNRYYQDGEYKADKLLKDMYIADNFDKIMQSAISQAVNQTRLAMLKQNKNITFDNEPSGTFKPSDTEEQVAALMSVFMGKQQR